jgi:glyoxylase-like metal-dependent hydrolase (beta-lactamase superfamily II)
MPDAPAAPSAPDQTTSPDSGAARPRRQEQEPASTEVTEVAPGVLRLQLPIDLPGLGHVNTYALEDERGFALVDPGLPGPKAWADLNDRLDRAGIPVTRVHTVVVTHSHPDHFGGAGMLAEVSGAEVLTSRWFRTVFDPDEAGEGGLQPAGLEADHDDEAAKRAAVEHILRMTQRPTPWGGRTDGFPPEQRAAMRENLDEALNWFRIPRPTIRVADRDPVRLAGRDWFAVETPGHTADHLCLLDPTEGVLLAGDHVLPSITPHISGLIGPLGDRTGEPDPLAMYVDSLDRVAALDGVRTVLPAHGHPFTDLVGRVDEVKAHHHERLDRLRQLSDGGGWASVVELSHLLFAPRSWGSMAESETYAHLEHLRLTGQGRRREVDGHLEYLLG